MEFAVLILLGIGLIATDIYRGPIAAARDALDRALERGEIRPQEYAAHLRALERTV